MSDDAISLSEIIQLLKRAEERRAEDQAHTLKVAQDLNKEALRVALDLDEKRDLNQSRVIELVGELKVEVAGIKKDVSDLKTRAAVADTRLTKVESVDKVGRALGAIATVLAVFAGADNESMRAWLGGLTGR